MNIETKRNLGIDILCCVGVLMLLGLQYMDAVGFETMPLETWGAAFPIAIRWFCLSGAALLSAGTGYILCAKKWTPGYFRILIRLLYIYLVCSALGIAMRVYLFNDFLSIEELIQTFFRFSATETTRFAGMYFALLIGAPYLNACFHGLKSRKAQLSLLALLLLVSGLQPMLYVRDFYVLPEWCKGLFPVAAYIGGAFIRKHMKKINFVPMLIVLLIVLALETVIVTTLSLSAGALNCTWLDSMATVPSISIALMLLLLFHSRKSGLSSAHLFFAGAAAGALVSLLLGDLMIDAALPAVIERTSDPVQQLHYGWFIVPVVFILGCVAGLVLQSPLLIVNSYLHSKDGEDEYEDEDEPRPSRRNSRPDVVVPGQTHTTPAPKKRSSSLHSISVPVSEPEVKVRLTQPSMDKPAGVHETILPSLPEEDEDVPVYRGKYFAEEPKAEEPDAVRVYTPPTRSLPQPPDRDTKVYVPKHAASPDDRRNNP